MKLHTQAEQAVEDTKRAMYPKTSVANKTVSPTIAGSRTHATPSTDVYDGAELRPCSLRPGSMDFKKCRSLGIGG